MRSTWARKSCPRPAPPLAPSIRPGMSARTIWRSSSSERAEHRRERRERVVGDLRPCAGEARQQRGLAGVGDADEADVGDQLQAQLDPPVLARKAALAETGRLARRSGELLVAPPAAAAASRDDALARLEQVEARAVRQRHLGSRRERDHDVLALRARFQRAAAVPSGAGLVMHLAPEPLQVAQRVLADEQDAAAAPAVAAVGPALGHVGLAAKAHRAVTAGAGGHMDPRAIGEHA